MKDTTRRIKVVLFAVLVMVFAGLTTQSRANDLPLASTSPLTGIAFDDRPLLLPVQRNFQMAMLTASSELGRSCGKMEAYGWRMGQTEQTRVNQIFNSTVDRLRLQGYAVAPQSLSSISSDLTLLTADKSDKHFIFLWSAGEMGLVMSLCETTAPAAPSSHAAAALTPPVQLFPVPEDVVPSRLEAAGNIHARASGVGTDFTPLGEWVGSYACTQGSTGGTLQITHLHGKDFEGIFKFYPTIKSPSVPSGSYSVYGQYDRDSQRILVNPGKWIQHPKNYYNTIMVGSFDPARSAFSAYFQGISGCTSFEASRTEIPPVPAELLVKKRHKKPVKHVAKKKKAAKPRAADASENVLMPTSVAPEVHPPVAAPVAVPAPVPAASAPVPAAAVAPVAPTAPVSTLAPVDDKKDVGGIPISGGK